MKKDSQNKIKFRFYKQDLKTRHLFGEFFIIYINSVLVFKIILLFDIIKLEDKNDL